MTYKEFMYEILNLDRRRPSSKSDRCKEYEIHHITPKCIGGSDDKDNLVYLTIAEHLRAHILLFRENQDNFKLACAAKMMADTREDFRDLLIEIVDDEVEFNNCIIDIVNARIAYSEWISENMSGENNPRKGVHLSKETKKKLHDANIGKHHTKETRQKISISHSGENNHMYNNHMFVGSNNPMFGKHHSEETKQILSEKAKQRLENPENHPMWGKHHSEETKQKIKDNRPDMSGGNSPRARAVICLDTQTIFETLTDAADFINKSHSAIICCCQGKTKTCGGYHWMYYDEYLANENDDSQLSL